MSQLPDYASAHFKAEDYVYTFKKAYLSITDPDSGTTLYAIASVKIVLPDGGYPTIGLVIAPEGFTGSDLLEASDTASFPMQAEIMAPDLNTFIEKNLEIQALVRKKGVTAGLELQMARAGGKDQQAVSIKNWVLAGSGVTQGTAAAGWTVEVTIAHPVYLATIGVGWIPNITDAMSAPAGTVADAFDLPALFVEALNKYLARAQQRPVTVEDVAGSLPSGIGVAIGADINEVAQQSLNRLADGAKVLEANTVWEAGTGSDLPYPSLSNLNMSATYLLRMMWVQISGMQSVWDQFASQMGAFELGVDGSPSDKPIVVGAFEPWGKPAYTVYDREIWSLSMPAYSTRDLAGTISIFNGGPETDVPSAIFPADGSNDVMTPAQLNGLAGYVEPMTATPPLAGPVTPIAPPEWLRNYLADNASSYSKDSNPVGEDKVNSAVESVAKDEAPEALPALGSQEGTFNNYVIAMRLYCWQVFLRSYRANAGISVGTRLRMQESDGSYLMPGACVEVDAVDESSGTAQAKPVLYFYITSVVHDIDVAGRTAHTNLVGSFVRSPSDAGVGGFTEDQIRNGIPNPMYQP